MITISKSYDFSAHHRLLNPGWHSTVNRKAFGRCYDDHGHNYKLTVEVDGQVDRATGMILNYFDLDRIVKPIVESYGDHKSLNKTFRSLRGRVTAENLVVAFADLIRLKLPDGVILTSVTIQETDKTRATWSLD